MNQRKDDCPISSGPSFNAEDSERRAQSHSAPGGQFINSEFVESCGNQEPIIRDQSRQLADKDSLLTEQKELIDELLERLHVTTELSKIAHPRNGPVEPFFYQGDAITKASLRPAPPPNFAGVPLRGHFNLLSAASFTGKSSLADWLAMAAIKKVSPWPGAPVIEGGNQLLLSPDASLEEVSKRIRSLAPFHPAGVELEEYVSHLGIVGPDADSDSAALDWLCFDETGFRTIESLIVEHAFTHVWCDAYADFLPSGASENDNSLGASIGKRLEQIAVRTGAAITVLHHVGHERDAHKSGDELPDLSYYGRGATALAQKARFITGIRRAPGIPHCLQLWSKTNVGAPPAPLTLQVAGETDPHKLLYFRPFSPDDRYAPGDYLEPGEWVSTSELAKRMFDPEGTQDKATASQRDTAKRCRDTWQARGQVRIERGHSHPRATDVQLVGDTPE